MILLDGRKLSQKILAEIKKDIEKNGKPLKLAVLVAGHDPATKNFIFQKEKAARSIGIEVLLHRFDVEIKTEDLCRKIVEISSDKNVNGVIVQLPLPPHIDRQRILDAIPPEKDIDVLSAHAVAAFASGRHWVMPPVAGAVKAFFEEYGIDYKNKRIAVVGAGNLVGKPVALWLGQEGISFYVMTEASRNPQDILRQADIIISGTGKPRWITGDMVKEGAVVIDAGTSESGGEIAGDVDFDSVSEKASFLTPVPGGVGPVTVAVLLRNLVVLAQSSRGLRIN